MCFRYRCSCCMDWSTTFNWAHCSCLQTSSETHAMLISSTASLHHEVAAIQIIKISLLLLLQTTGHGVYCTTTQQTWQQFSLVENCTVLWLLVALFRQPEYRDRLVSSVYCIELNQYHAHHFLGLGQRHFSLWPSFLPLVCIQQLTHTHTHIHYCEWQTSSK